MYRSNSGDIATARGFDASDTRYSFRKRHMGIRHAGKLEVWVGVDHMRQSLPGLGAARCAINRGILEASA